MGCSQDIISPEELRHTHFIYITVCLDRPNLQMTIHFAYSRSHISLSEWSEVESIEWMECEQKNAKNFLKWYNRIPQKDDNSTDN